MLSKNSNGSFDEHPYHEAGQVMFCLFVFVVNIVERLLHGFCKSFSEPLRIQGEKFPVDGTDSILLIHIVKVFGKSFRSCARVTMHL